MAEEKGGFIKISRGLFNNFLWSEAREFSKAEAWIDLIQSARFEASTEFIQGKVIELQRGELPASRRYLELRWNWGSTKVSNFLKLLEQMKMINHRQTNGQTIIKLVKYGVFNDKQTTNKPPTNHRQTTDKPPTNQSKEDKELEEDKESILLEKETKENQDFPNPQDFKNLGDGNSNSKPLENNTSKKVAQKKVSKIIDFKNKLLELGVAEKDAEDWIEARKQKRAVFTENAIKNIQNECEKYNISFPEAIHYSGKYGWQGFEYEWYLNKKKKENGKSNNQGSYNGNNNSFGNSKGSNNPSQGRKMSYREMVAKATSNQTQSSSDSGSITIEAEICD